MSHGGDEPFLRSIDGVAHDDGDEPIMAASLGSISQIADYLNTGYWASKGLGARHWSPGATISVNITALTTAERGLATSALNAWHEIANISFSFTIGAAQITYNHNGSGIAGTSSSVSGTSLT